MYIVCYAGVDIFKILHFTNKISFLNVGLFEYDFCSLLSLEKDSFSFISIYLFFVIKLLQCVCVHVCVYV